MNRRTFVATGLSVGALIATAGCTERTLHEADTPPDTIEDRVAEAEVRLPVRGKFDVLEEAVLVAADAEVTTVDELEAFLDDAGLDVRDLSETEHDGDAVLSLEYAVGRAEDGVLRGVGVIAGGYAALLDAGHESGSVDASLLDATGRTFGAFEVRASWATEYNEGRRSAAAYGRRVADELESSDV